MANIHPGSTLICGPGLLDNPHVHHGLLADSYFFDVTMRAYAVGDDDPYVVCSLRFKSIVDCKFMTSNIYILTVKVSPINSRLPISLDVNPYSPLLKQVAAFIPNMHPPSPTYSNRSIALIGDIKTVSIAMLTLFTPSFSNFYPDSHNARFPVMYTTST
jgi:hypothetical protein